LIKPLREGRAGDVAMFQAFARSPKVRVVNVDLQAATHAATIRAQFNLKLPDSLHLSAAVSTSADVFLTLDADFDRCIGHLPIIIRRLNP
jgi:predicted nucleic acid-binding protein